MDRRLRHRRMSFRCTNNMCHRLHRPPNYNNHCGDPFRKPPDSRDSSCWWQSFAQVPMSRHHFRKCFACCRWQCRGRCASSTCDCADAIWNVCSFLCNSCRWGVRRCHYYYSYFALDCCANSDSNCAISANDPNIPMNIGTIVAVNSVWCICAPSDCASWEWLAVAGTLEHHSCCSFCKEKERMSIRSMGLMDDMGLPGCVTFAGIQLKCLIFGRVRMIRWIVWMARFAILIWWTTSGCLS